MIRRFGWEFPGAGVDRLINRTQTKLVANDPDLCFGATSQGRDLNVAKAVVFGVLDELASQLVGSSNRVSNLVDENDLVDEPRVDLGGLEDLLDSRSGAQGLLNIDDSPVGRNLDELEQ